jgi:hypothetical protein
MSLPGDAEEVDLPDREEFEQGFAAAAEALDALRNGGHVEPESETSDEADHDAEQAGAPDDVMLAMRGAGRACDGQIVATVRQGGEVESVTLDPLALRRGPDELGRQLADAINSALDDLNAQVIDQTTSLSGLDPDRLADDLTAVQDLVAERVGSLAQSYDDAMARISRSGSTR